MRNIYRQLVAMFCLATASQWVTASTLTNVTTDVKVIAGDTVDMLVPATPNVGLISYSKFSNFSVNRPLKILNTSDAHGLNGKTAQLIIIQADNIDLRAGIELIGEVADILFVSSNQNHNIICYSCSMNRALMKAFHRLPQVMRGL